MDSAKIHVKYLQSKKQMTPDFKKVNDSIIVNKTIDAKGLECPLPILRTKLALTELQCGDILEIHTTDPHASIDFHAFCARSGHKLLYEIEEKGTISFYLRCDTGD